MAVYTLLSRDDIAELLALYDVGGLQAFSAISAGIENSNYAITTDDGEFVLTIFEHHAPDEVRSFVRLGRHLGTRNLRVPSPIEDQAGCWLHTLKHKPAILCQRFPGSHPEMVTEQHCAAIGRELAEFHLASADLTDPRQDERGYDWWQAVAPDLSADLSPDDQQLLNDELLFQRHQRQRWLALPHGWIHADLFHDNALFDGTDLTAILDLYNACEGAWLYDLAIVANDWCVATDGVTLDEARVSALTSAYRAVRNIDAEEWGMWTVVLRGAALRFWLSRLLAARLARSRCEELPAHKQPVEYRNRLLSHRAG